jgi:hypothetical protein
MKGIISREKLYKDKFLSLPNKKQDDIRKQVRAKITAQLLKK